MSNYQCPIGIHCSDYPFANLSSEGIDLSWLPPRGQYWTAVGYCCDGAQKTAWSGESQTAANSSLDYILATACPTCDDTDKLKFCADANCPDGTLLTTKCVPTSQADADALAAAAADAMLPYCDDKGQLFVATCTCPDGVSDPHTVYSNISQPVAEADCAVIPKSCEGVVCNTEQTCDFNISNHTRVHWCVAAGTVCATTLAQANAEAASLACVYANFGGGLSALSAFACLNESFSEEIYLTGISGSFTWTTSGSVPPGLSLTKLSDNIAQLSGTPTAQGSYTFSVTAWLTNCSYVQRQYTIVIFGFITDPTLPDGTVGTAYSEQIIADGGSGNYFFSVTAGTLPDGLALGDTGFITGTPTTEETTAFTVTAQDLVTPAITCSLQFQLDILPAPDPFDTSTIITAVKSHYAIGLNDVYVWGDCSSVGTTDVTGVVFYKEGAAVIGNGNCGTYGVADPVNLGALVASKIVHGDLTGTGSYHDSSSPEMEVFGVGYWPNTVQIDGISLAAFQTLDAGVLGVMTIAPGGTFVYNDASLSISLLAGSTFVFQWLGGYAIYKRDDNSLVPTGLFHFYQGTASPVSDVTIT